MQNLSRQTVVKKIKAGPALVDSRDGKTYATVIVAGTTWMAENLRFDTLNGVLSWAPNCDTARIKKYGRLYNWRGAMRADSGIIFQCDVNLPQRGICPVGWHLPSKDEWMAMADSLGGAAVAGRVLKEDSVWLKRIDGKAGTGVDSVGFSALPAGYRFTGDQGYLLYGHTNADSSFFDLGIRAMFWTRTNNVSGSCWSAWGATMSRDYDAIDWIINARSAAMSVRCAKD